MPVIKKSESLKQKITPGFERRIAYLGNIMVVICDFTSGPMAEPDKQHSHPHEQISYLEEGELWLFLGKEKHHLTKGDIYTVPGGIPHSIQTLSSFVRLIDSFSPVREDFITK
jgi:mannose-6-phosphate isomerase-like protein (cupin superfamily)